MIRALTCLCLLASAMWLRAWPADDESPPVIVLRGSLESKKERGAVIYLLKLPKPVTARGLALADEGGDPLKGFQKLQLICDHPGLPDCEAILSQSIGHPVRIVGQPARNGAESDRRVPVVMHVRLITVLQ